MKGNTPCLVVNGLKKHYGDGEARVQVLDGITASVNKGEICVMLGPSGSGKSTFLNLIGGLEDVDGDSIAVASWASSSSSITSYPTSRSGRTSRSPRTSPRTPLPMEDLLCSLGLWEHRNKFPRQVSGGQQQRCAIGRALVKNPGLILCDEPTGALDYKTSKEVLELMERVNREYGCTLVIVTHNAAIAKMADRVLRLRDGRLASDKVNASPVSASELDW